MLIFLPSMDDNVEMAVMVSVTIFYNPDSNSGQVLTLIVLELLFFFFFFLNLLEGRTRMNRCLQALL